MTTSEMTPADISAITGGNSNGWGGSWSEWIIIFLIFALCGWGGRGFGGNGTGTDGVMNNYVLSSDFGQIDRKLDGIANGICDSTYALNNTITNGFASAQNTMTQGFAGLNTALVQQGYEGRIATQNVGTQLSQCCCDIREGISGVNYNMSTQANGISRQISDTGYAINTAVDKGFCQTNFNNSNNTRDIIASQHSDADRILARLDAMETNRLKEQLDNERANRLALQGALDRAELRTNIVNDVRPCPTPAYITCNPWAYQQTNSCCGCNQ